MKDKLRNEWLQVRKNIPESRRLEASKQIYTKLQPLLKNHRIVLSYASFNDELSTAEINQKLIEKKSLALPRIVDDELWVYSVENPLKQLIKTPFGIPEPNPNLCRQIEPGEVSHILVPAIAFDSKNHRLGYGKGYFDRFLEKHKKNAVTIGIGFIETYSKKPFPAEPHDVFLDQIILV